LKKNPEIDPEIEKDRLYVEKLVEGRHRLSGSLLRIRPGEGFR
jgi:hypothetical protein